MGGLIRNLKTSLFQDQDADLYLTIEKIDHKLECDQNNSGYYFLPPC